ncbi:MAG: putative transrane protein [Rhodocyclaceae bacterium]|nr:putative transrane protein [Rhodocyclaceae bacterium]
MRAQTLPAAAGWRWLVDGFAIFRRNPPLLVLLVISYWFTILLLNVVPILGAVLASLAIPGLSVGLMQACRDLERGEPVGLPTLFGSLKDNPRALTALGALYLVATLGILGLSTLVDGGDLLRFMLSTKPVDPEAVAGGRLLLPFALVMTLLVPVLMAYWYAPVLAAWHKLPVFKALFFSFVACWLNWRPFVVYGLGLLGVAAIGPGMVLGLLLTLFPGAQNFLATLVTVPMVLVVAPTVFASFYVSYRDVFTISDSA